MTSLRAHRPPRRGSARCYAGAPYPVNQHVEPVDSLASQLISQGYPPAIPDGSWCLFRAPVEGTRQGKTVLVQLRDATDPESGQRYTVKRYESEKAAEGDSLRHERILLKPANSDFEPIVLTGADEHRDVLRGHAELGAELGLRPLGGQNSPGARRSSLAVTA